MKILLVGDLHARTATPAKRLDENFLSTFLDKLSQIVQIAKYNNAIILQAGDWHDSFSPDKLLLIKEIELLANCGVDIFTIHGQHDMRYHSQSSTKHSAIRVLEAAKCLCVLDEKEPFRLHDDVNIYAAPYGTSPILDIEDDAFNILVSHVMVMNKPLYINHEYISPTDYMKEFPGYDMYFVGDIHTPFVSKRNGNLMINAGSVLRSSIDQKDYKPKVILFDTDDKSYSDIYLDVKEDVFDLVEIKKIQENKFEGMIEKLRESGKISVNFKDNLDLFIKKHKINKNIVDIIEENYYNKIGDK